MTHLMQGLMRGMNGRADRRRRAGAGRTAPAALRLETLTTRSLTVLLTALAAGGSAACTIASTDPPVISGPSELGLALTLQASPEVLTQDGISQAVVSVLARDPYGRPLSAVEMRADIAVGGVLQDFGRLSARSLTTGRDGRASVVYTAPEPVLGVSQHTVITLVITPLTGDARAQMPRAVDIRLVPLLPPPP